MFSERPRPETGAVTARITTLGVPTRRRVESLRRCLSSYLECCRCHDRALSLVVVDDSDAATAWAGRDMMASLPRVAGVELLHAGPEDRLRFVAALASRSGVAPEVLDFGLLNPEGCPLTTGASRNALLLHAAGEMLLQTDDDTVCCLSPTPEACPGQESSALRDPTEFWFFAEDEPLPVAEPGAEDVFALHESLLGQGAAVTTTGVLGDSGMGSVIHLLALQGASRARLLQSESLYRQALGGGRVLRAVRRATLCEGAYCMALNLGLDNRRLLPPFLPVQRNQDGVFAALLKACAGGLQGFLPWAVLHDPPARRRAGTWEDVGLPRTGHAFQVLIGSAATQADAGEVGDRLRAVGATLEDQGLLPPKDFEQLLATQWRRQLGGLGRYLTELLRRHQGQPEYWADDVRRVLTAWAECLSQTGSVVPADLAEAFGPEPARGLMQRLVLRFGRLVRAWPDLVEAARDLRSGGVRLAVPVA